MAFPTDTFTHADLDAYIPEVWGQKINDFYKKKLVLADFFTDRSDELANGGDVLHTPNTTEMAASAKVNAQAVTLVSPTDTKVDLTVDQWFEVSFAIEDRQAAQVARSYSIMETYAKNAGYALAKKLEVAIAAKFVGFSTVVGATNAAITDAVIRSAIGTLSGRGVDMDEVSFFFNSTTFWTQVQNLDKFSLSQNSASADPANAPTYRLYGIPVRISEFIGTGTGAAGIGNALAHKDAIHYATSPLGAGSSKGKMVGTNGIRVQSNYIPEFLSTVTTADILYGVVENRDEAGVLIDTQ
jgi:hypothetical protein